jgi:hypothetical protein
MALDTPFIREALDHLRRRDRRPQTAAALSHRYRVGPTLTEDEIRIVESEYAFTVPDSYRQLLLEVGNGGAGPNWGLMSLGLWPAPRGEMPWKEIFPGWFPGVPFRFDREWNEPASFFAQEPDGDGLSEEEQLEEADRWESQLLHYWRAELMDGAIPISEVGCGIFEWLVVSGDERGNIWADSRSDYRGIFPVMINGERATFESWYMEWLDECLEARPLRPKGGLLGRLFSRGDR